MQLKSSIKSLTKLSTGVIPVLREGSESKYLALRVYNYWDFPKGLVKKDENPIESALRELHEETGLVRTEFPWGEDYIETEPYAHQKIARYYLGEVFDTHVKISPEHHEFGWFSAKELNHLFGERLQKILTWGVARSTLAPTFLVDENVSGLAKWLRLVGWDVLVTFGSSDDEVLVKAFEDGRVILTSDRRLSNRVANGLCMYLPQESIFQQFLRILDKFSLPAEQCWFSRCTICNVYIRPYEKVDFNFEKVPQEIQKKYLSGTFRLWNCPHCERFYWKGSHLERITKRLEQLSLKS